MEIICRPNHEASLNIIIKGPLEEGDEGMLVY
jgi:hypothetical protein